MNALEILRQLNQHGFTNQLQQRVIDLGDPELAYRFGHQSPEADLDLLEEVIDNAKTPRIAYEFALIKAERGGDVERLQQLVIDCLDGGLMILFAADVDGADIELIEEAVRRHPDPKYIQLFEAEMRQKGFY